MTATSSQSTVTKLNYSTICDLFFIWRRNLLSCYVIKYKDWSQRIRIGRQIEWCRRAYLMNHTPLVKCNKDLSWKTSLETISCNVHPWEPASWYYINDLKLAYTVLTTQYGTFMPCGVDWHFWSHKKIAHESWSSSNVKLLLLFRANPLFWKHEQLSFEMW